MQRLKLIGLALALGTAVACSNESGNPLAPGAGGPGGTGANPDGTTLKATAPVTVGPKDRVTVEGLRPALQFQNSTGRFTNTNFTYQVELYQENALLATYTVASGGGTTTFQIPDDVPMVHDTLYRWRARATFEGGLGPWSVAADFITPKPPQTGGGSTGGGGVGVDGTRDIGVNEAWGIIVRVHNELGYDLGSRSSREQRVDFLWTAVAVIHFGHPRFNPAGGDPGWCVKDAGGGRPPSDDVLVRCGSRDAWDLIGSAGANGYSFHLDYLGRLDGGQNVYPPPRGHLPR